MIARNVIKIGGSCLTHPNLVHFVNNLLAEYRGSQNLIIVGGGKCIDAMRELSAKWVLDQKRMHWRCVDLLRNSYEIFAELNPELRFVSDPESFGKLIYQDPWQGDYLVAVDVFYNLDESPESALPVGWETTTDSIAALLARWAAANELCLVKSCPVPTIELAELSSLGIVDSAFQHALPATIKLRIVTIG